MRFRQYNWNVQDTTGHSYGSVPVIVPEYTQSEYNAFKSHWDSAFGTSSGVEVAVQETGQITDAGAYLRNNMGMKFVSPPMIRPVADSDWNKAWYEVISPQFPMTDQTQLFSQVPITSSGRDWTRSKFKVGSATPSSDQYPDVYFNTAGYESMGGRIENMQPCAYSAAGARPSTDSNQYIEIIYTYIVDGVVHSVSVGGYYDQGTKGLTSIYPFSVTHTNDYIADYYGSAHYDYVEPPDPDDPDGDPYNNPGEGDFDDGNSDDIDNPSLPTISATDTGFITLYNPSAAQLKSLASYMWSDLFSLDTLKKLFADPMSTILGLSILPIAVPSGGLREVKIGNIGTGISLPIASAQFLEVNCGTITLKRQSPGTYLDFSPYTKVDLYLPFIGTHPLNVDEVMGKTINVKYHVDILSGACTAFVKVGSSILYQFIGACAISIPITGNDWTRAINGALNIAGSIGSMVLTGGATAPMSVGSIASTAVNSLKPNVEKSGAAGGSGGLMGVKRPYLIIQRPNRNVAKNQYKYIGYPTWKTLKMSSLNGFNSVETARLNIAATSDEIDEIETLLKKGAIF